MQRKDYLDDVDGAQGREYVKQKSKTKSAAGVSNEVRGSVIIDLRKEKKLDDALACMKIEKEAGSLRKPLGREISGPISGTIPKYVVKNSKNKSKSVVEKAEENHHHHDSKDLEISQKQTDSNNNDRSRTKSSSSSIPPNTNNTTTISSSNNNISTVPLTLSVKDLMNR